MIETPWNVLDVVTPNRKFWMSPLVNTPIPVSVSKRGWYFQYYLQWHHLLDRTLVIYILNTELMDVLTITSKLEITKTSIVRVQCWCVCSNDCLSWPKLSILHNIHLYFDSWCFERRKKSTFQIKSNLQIEQDMLQTQSLMRYHTRS